MTKKDFKELIDYYAPWIVLGLVVIFLYTFMQNLAELSILISGWIK